VPEEKYVTVEFLVPAHIAEWVEARAKLEGVSTEEFVSKVLHEIASIDNETLEKVFNLLEKALPLEKELNEIYSEIMDMLGIESYLEFEEFRLKLLLFLAATTPPEEMRKILAQKEER